jgi:sulfur carrier protein
MTPSDEKPMKVFVNGEERELVEGATVTDLVEQAGAPAGGRGVAVAVDSQVVPRSEWERTKLSAGQRVELVAAIQGG